MGLEELFVRILGIGVGIGLLCLPFLVVRRLIRWIRQ